MHISSLEGLPFTYDEVGATADPSMPSGYHHLRERTHVGRGREVLSRASETLLTFDMHRRAGFRVVSSEPRSAVGVIVVSTLGLGPVGIPAPCRVVHVTEEVDRAGFAYGTLPGHPERGEESFLLELDERDDVWLTVTAFSTADRWFVRLGGPLSRLFQRWFARRCGRVLASASQVRR